MQNIRGTYISSSRSLQMTQTKASPNFSDSSVHPAGDSCRRTSAAVHDCTTQGWEGLAPTFPFCFLSSETTEITTTGERLWNTCRSYTLTLPVPCMGLRSCTTSSLKNTSPSLQLSSLHAHGIEANPLQLGNNLWGICSSATVWDSSVLANIQPQCKLLYRT